MRKISKYLLFILIIIFPFIVTLPRGMIIPKLRIDEVLIILGVIALILSGKRIYKFTGIEKVLLILSIIGFLSILGVYYRNETPEIIEYLSQVKWLVVIILLTNTIETENDVNKIIFVLVIISIPVAMIGVLQRYDMINSREILSKIYSDTSAGYLLTGKYIRATSTLGNWNALGGYAVLSGLLGLSVFRYTPKKQFRTIAFISICASIIMLVIAGSSNSIVGFSAGFAVWLTLQFKRKTFSKFSISKRVVVVILGILIAFPIFIFVGKDIIQAQIERQTRSVYFTNITGRHYDTGFIPSSVFVRLLIADKLVDQMNRDKLALLFGFGEGETSESRYVSNSAESGYLTMSFSFGFAYLIFYLILMITNYRYGLFVKRNNITEISKIVSTTVITTTVALSLMIIIHSYHRAAGVAHFYWIIIGAMIVLYWIHKKKRLTIKSKV
jgi:hypothetical protein